MRKQITMVVLLAALGLTSVSAQQPERDQRQGNASPSRPTEDRPRFQNANVRVELTVTDTVGTNAPQKKTVSMMIADGMMGRIRAYRPGSSTRTPSSTATLNVDATPTITGERVRLQISLEYIAPLMGASATRLAAVTELVTVLLEQGKPTTISQSADPSTDRKVNVEVTATILK